MKELFKGKQYLYELIREAVIIYCSTPLSYRDCEKLMARYLVKVDHTTIGSVAKFEN